MSWLEAQVSRTLAYGSPRAAAALVITATLVATLASLRQAMLVPFEQLAYGEGRSPLIDTLLASLGRDRTAVVVYLLERSWQPALAVSALGPLLLWILGSTAVHAAARMRGAVARLMPLLVLSGYAVAAARIPADLAAMTAPPLAGPIGLLSTIGLGLLAWLALRRHYGFARGRAFTTLLVAILFFYLAPLVLIFLSVIAILIAAIVLDYVA